MASVMMINYRYKGSKSGASSGKGNNNGNNNNNKSNQMNPNNEAYFKSHGWGSKPESSESHTPQEGNNRADQKNPNNPKGGNQKK